MKLLLLLSFLTQLPYFVHNDVVFSPSTMTYSSAVSYCQGLGKILDPQNSISCINTALVAPGDFWIEMHCDGGLYLVNCPWFTGQPNDGPCGTGTPVVSTFSDPDYFGHLHDRPPDEFNYAACETIAETEEETLAETEIETLAETQEETFAETETDTNDETLSETATETGTDTTFDTNDETLSETATETGTDTTFDTNDDTLSETVADSDAESLGETKYETVAETQSEAFPETEEEYDTVIEDTGSRGTSSGIDRVILTVGSVLGAIIVFLIVLVVVLVGGLFSTLWYICSTRRREKDETKETELQQVELNNDDDDIVKKKKCRENPKGFDGVIQSMERVETGTTPEKEIAFKSKDEYATPNVGGIHKPSTIEIENDVTKLRVFVEDKKYRVCFKEDVLLIGRRFCVQYSSIDAFQEIRSLNDDHIISKYKFFKITASGNTIDVKLKKDFSQKFVEVLTGKMKGGNV